MYLGVIIVKKKGICEEIVQNLNRDVKIAVE